MRKRLKVLALPLVGVAVAAAALVVPSSPAGSAPAHPGRPAPRPLHPVSVTLVTGDRVVVGADGTGQASVSPGPGRGRMTFQQARDGRGHLLVLPADALPLLAADRLDRRLFDVTALVQQGFTDERSAALPLLVGHARGGSLPASARAGDTRVTRALPRLGLTAVAQPRDRAGDFWRSVRGSGPRPRALATGMTKLWLDGRVRAALDQSVPQIHAPELWQQGTRGAGVRIAVLDTGYAAGHPDLAGAVVAARGFTAAGPAAVADDNGHGTHVASIAAGRGTASAGRYTGTAPEASLVVGKVLDGDGAGFDDQIIAGMQWAAVEQHARVINMSLGGGPTDGTDPMSQVVDQLTAETGALFVIAAGNSGADRTVGSPAAADAALAVGSVTKQDELSGFSSRGPRLGDDAIKPEIVAPGTAIIAARAAGTPLGDNDPVDDSYTRLNGTSMASPHVAGAAALLAQRHPDWRAGQLKAALMGAATVLPDLSVYAQGAGRLDVAAAARQTLRADLDSVGFGLLSWPYANAPDRTRTVTVSNDGDAAAVLATGLDVTAGSGAAAPAGLLSVSPATLTVPAHGTGTVTVTLRPRVAVPGLYSAQLTLTPAGAGAAPLHLPVGVHAETEAYDLSIHSIARTGAAPGPSLLVVARPGDRADTFVAVTGPDGSATVRVPPGRYDVLGHLTEPVPDGAESPLSSVARTGVTVTAPTAVTMDARAAAPVAVAVDEPSARPLYRSLGLADATAGVSAQGPGDLRAYAATGPAPGLRYDTRATLARPEATLTVAGPDPVDPPLEPLAVARTVPGSSDHRVVDGGQGRPEDLAGIDVRGRIVLLRYADDVAAVPPRSQVAALAAAGAAAAIYPPFPTTAFEFGNFILTDRPLPIPAYVTSGTGFQRLAGLAAAGPATARLAINRASPYVYNLVFTARDRLPGGTTYRPRKDQLARVDASYRALGRPSKAAVAIAVTDPALVLPGEFDLRGVGVDLPMTRTEYLTGGAWRTEVRLGGLGEASQATEGTFQPGRTYHPEWNVAVLAPKLDGDPALGGQPAVARAGDDIFADISSLSESTPGRFARASRTHDQGEIGLRRDGVELGTFSAPAAYPDSGGWTVPADPGDYQLHLLLRRDVPGWNLTTGLSTTWTFRSGHVDGDEQAPLPLLQVGYRVPLDATNAMPARRPSGFELAVTRQAGAPAAAVTGVRCAASFDDGRTWQDLTVRRHGDGWQVDPPRGGSPGGYVTLRVTAADAGGSRVDQTITRAFAFS